MFPYDLYKAHRGQVRHTRGKCEQRVLDINEHFHSGKSCLYVTVRVNVLAVFSQYIFLRNGCRGYIECTLICDVYWLCFACTQLI